MKLSSASIYFHSEVTCNKSRLRALSLEKIFRKCFNIRFTFKCTRFHRLSMKSSFNAQRCLLNLNKHPLDWVALWPAYHLWLVALHSGWHSSTSVVKFFNIQPLTQAHLLHLSGRKSFPSLSQRFDYQLALLIKGMFSHFPQERFSSTSRWMHSALFTCFRWKLSQFSSWLKKHIGFCCRLSAFFLCAHPPSQQIKLSLIVQRSWARRTPLMPSEALIIKSTYVLIGFCSPVIDDSFFNTIFLSSSIQIEIIVTKIIIQNESLLFTCGYFDINMRLMHSIVGTSITYLVILLQFNFE